jgi:two-component system, LytTR family, response regulator
MSIKALIVDDEESARNMMRALITRYVPEISELQMASGASDAFFIIKEFRPDLVFLDIQMPFMNGFDLLGKLDVINFDVIFTTAFNQYAIQAIRFSALDYLLKPIDTNELKSAVDRHIQRRLLNQNVSQQYRHLVQNLNNNSVDDFTLSVGSNHGMKFFRVNEIVRLEGERNYTNFFLSGNRTCLSSKTLKEYEELLADKGFLRAHKSHMVNIAFVRNMSADGFLVMEDDSRVEISRRRLSEVRRFIEEWKR